MNNEPISGSGGSLGRLMIARVQRVEFNKLIYGPYTTTYAIPLDPKQPRSDYFTNRNEGDPFPDPIVIYTNNVMGGERKREYIEGIFQRSK